MIKKNLDVFFFFAFGCTRNSDCFVEARQPDLGKKAKTARLDKAKARTRAGHAFRSTRSKDPEMAVLIAHSYQHRPPFLDKVFASKESWSEQISSSNLRCDFCPPRKLHTPSRKDLVLSSKLKVKNALFRNWYAKRNDCWRLTQQQSQMTHDHSSHSSQVGALARHIKCFSVTSQDEA